MSRRGFNRLPAVARMLPEAAANLVEKATVDIAAQAGATAPIDTGALAESYHAEVDGLEGIAGTNQEYAPHVEYGTRTTGAQPHLTPAYERVQSAISGYSREFGDDVEGAARGGS